MRLDEELAFAPEEEVVARSLFNLVNDGPAKMFNLIKSMPEPFLSILWVKPETIL